jgi:hypothetical protein
LRNHTPGTSTGAQASWFASSATKEIAQVSFTPGFSQAQRRVHSVGNRLNGFLFLALFSVTWLKPGVNKINLSSFAVVVIAIVIV